MQLKRYEKSTRSLDGFYMFSCQPRLISPPKLINALKESVLLDDVPRRKSSCSFEQPKTSALQYSGRNVKSTRALTSPSGSLNRSSGVKPHTPTELSALIAQDITTKTVEKNVQSCQTEFSTQNTDTVDIGIQFNEIIEEGCSIECLSEKSISEITEQALSNILCDTSVLNKSDELCPSCKKIVNSSSKNLTTLGNHQLIAVKVFSESLIDELIPSIMQKLEDHKLLYMECKYDEDLGNFLPWFLDEFEKGTNKLEELCQKCFGHH